jgi:hypothetical protein
MNWSHFAWKLPFKPPYKTETKIQGGIEVTGRQERRRSKLLDDLKGRRRYSYLKDKALDCSIWKDRFGRGFGPVVRQTTK